jgi:hypothetical protein
MSVRVECSISLYHQKIFAERGAEVVQQVTDAEKVWQQRSWLVAMLLGN